MDLFVPVSLSWLSKAYTTSNWWYPSSFMIERTDSSSIRACKSFISSWYPTFKQSVGEIPPNKKTILTSLQFDSWISSLKILILNLCYFVIKIILHWNYNKVYGLKSSSLKINLRLLIFYCRDVHLLTVPGDMIRSSGRIGNKLAEIIPERNKSNMKSKIFLKIFRRFSFS